MTSVEEWRRIGKLEGIYASRIKMRQRPPEFYDQDQSLLAFHHVLDGRYNYLRRSDEEFASKEHAMAWLTGVQLGIVAEGAWFAGCRPVLISSKLDEGLTAYYMFVQTHA